MATTIEVSTWAELVSAVLATVEYPYTWSDTTIKLTADINLNDTDSTGVCCQVNFPAYAIIGVGSGIVIDGGYIDSETGKQKSHVIKNARTDISNPRPIFYLNDSLMADRYDKYITFKNLDFQNLILSTQPFVWIRTDNITTGGYGVRLENCRFCGNRGNTYLFFSNNNLTCENCYFDMPWNGAGQSNLAYTSLIPKNDSNAPSAIANYCRFKETYGNWEYSTVTNSYGASSQAMFSFSYFKVNGCRIEGSMTLPRGEYIDVHDYTRYGMYAKLLGKPTANSYTPNAQNVFDVNLTLGTNNYQSGDTVNVSGWSGVVRKDAVRYDGETAFNDYIYVQGNGDYGGAITPIFATPEQMKDASYLNSQGFDIVVPNT